jgi:hypothetical protein
LFALGKLVFEPSKVMAKSGSITKMALTHTFQLNAVLDGLGISYQ